MLNKTTCVQVKIILNVFVSKLLNDLIWNILDLIDISTFN